MIYFWYIFFGLAPSTIWLLIFVAQDHHPESKRMILKVFFYGMLSALFLLPILILGEGLFVSLSDFLLMPLIILQAVILAPLLEETVKYLVVRLKVIGHSEFDEPVDAKIYMIVAALGFAAAENLLYMAPYLWGELKTDPLVFSAMRFIGATFLHALCSALVGYYLALSFLNLKNRVQLICKGLFIAMVLHGIYNFFIIKIEESTRKINGEVVIVDQSSFITFNITSIVLLVGLAAFIIYSFKKVKKIKSVCEE